jgi:DNA modification methylase
MTIRILEGDCREVLRTLPAESVHCCVTSPPYYGLRDYGVDGQIGLEETPEQFIAQLVVVFREVRRVLRDDGTLWLNIGDSYAGYHGNKNAAYCDAPSNKGGYFENQRASTVGLSGLKQKDLIGIPWMLAFALRADGWYLRQDIIWHKPNPMPESVRDRCTKAHEYLFLLTKSARYYFDADAIKEPVTATTVARLSQNVDAQVGSDRVPGKTNGAMKAVRSKANSFKREGSKREQAIPGQTVGTHRPDRVESEYDLDTRNKRSVWTIATQPFKQAHFATFPPALVEPCILAGCPEGGTVLDPFGGAGTTGLVADRLGRDAILVELNPAYAEIARKRIHGDSPLFAKVANA